MMNDELMHRSHKYISRKWKNGRWVYKYKYNKIGNNTNEKSREIPKEYKPSLTKSTLYGKNDKGYTNSDGVFFRGNYESARRQAYEYDLKKSNAKMQSQLKEQNYRNSVKRHVDDVGKDITTGVEKVSSLSKKTIDKGRKRVAKFLRDMADDIE